MNQKFKKLTAISLAALLGLTAAPASAFAQSFTEIEQASLTDAISALAQQYALFSAFSFLWIFPGLRTYVSLPIFPWKKTLSL